MTSWLFLKLWKGCSWVRNRPYLIQGRTELQECIQACTSHLCRPPAAPSAPKQSTVARRENPENPFWKDARWQWLKLNLDIWSFPTYKQLVCLVIVPVLLSWIKNVNISCERQSTFSNSDSIHQSMYLSANVTACVYSCLKTSVIHNTKYH